MKILVVCTGNICRSPMGEVVLRDYLEREGLGEPEILVASAGTSDEEHGGGVDRRAAQVLREAGYEVPRDHRAHRATAAELRESDLVLAMTVGHARLLRGMLESAGEDPGKLHLWREFDGTLSVASGGVFGEGGVLSATHENAKRAKRSHYSDQYTSDGEFDVPDPWYGGLDGFYDTLAVVEAGAAGIVEYLRSQG